MIIRDEKNLQGIGKKLYLRPLGTHQTQDMFRNFFPAPLTGEEITTKNYQRAQDTWTTFNCTTLQDYHDIYLTSDVLLLADVFEKFRKTCINNYGLDSVHYLSAPGLAFDAALKMTKVNLELFTDVNMHLFIEN